MISKKDLKQKYQNDTRYETFKRYSNGEFATECKKDERIDTIYKNSNVELPSLETQKIGLSDNNVVSSYTFLSNNDNV